MDRRAQGALMLALGGVAIRLGVTGTALNYIRGAYVPLLLAAGVIVAVLGAVTLWQALTGQETGGTEHDHGEGVAYPADADTMGVAPVDAHGHEHTAPDDHASAEHGGGHDAHGHDHSRGPAVAWLLAAPLFAILLIAPPPLGSFAASRQSGVVAAPTAAWPEMPAPEAGAVPLGLGDYASRALYDTDLSLAGTRVRLTGFVSEATEDGFLLTRFALSCCAADGTAINVEVVTDAPVPPVDSWVEVEGTWEPRPGHAIGELTTDPPLLIGESLKPVPQPAEPYET